MRISDWSSDVCSSDLWRILQTEKNIMDIDAAELRKLLDKEAIREASLRYTRGIDRHDDEIMAQAYHPNATDDHGAYIGRSEEHTSELQSLMRISYAVFCLKKKNKKTNNTHNDIIQTQQPHVDIHK